MPWKSGRELNAIGNDVQTGEANGVVNAVTPTDLRVMDVLGWDLASVVVDVTGHGHGSGGGGGAGGSFADAPGFIRVDQHHVDAVAPRAHVAAHVEASQVAPGPAQVTYDTDWHIV